MIVDIKKIRNKKEEDLLKRIKKRKFIPMMLIIQVEGDEASNVYVKKKKEYLAKLGITVIHQSFENNVTEFTLFNFIKHLKSEFDGIMLQLPLPNHLKKYEQDFLDAIPEHKDVDRLSTMAIGKSANGYDEIVAPTAQACLDVMEEFYSDSEFEGLGVNILGRSNLVGKPLYNALLKKNSDVYMIHSKSGFDNDFSSAFSLLYPEVIITAMGIKGAFNNEDLPISTKLIIDCGINFENKKMYGDYEESLEKYMTYTPVGRRRMGIGGLTVFNVANNLLKLIEREDKKC